MKNIFFIIFLLITDSVFAQKKYFLHLQNGGNQEIKTKIFVFPDTLQTQKELIKIILAYQEQGFLLASADSVFWQKDTLKAFIFIGKPFRWERLSAGNVPADFLNNTHFSEKTFRNRIFSQKNIEQLRKKILQNAENQGYPFAGIKLDSIQLNQEKISASLQFIPDELILFDTISIVGSAKIRQKTLQVLLRLQKDDFFSRQRIENVDNILQKLSFLRLQKPSEVIFTKGRASLQIFADERKSNQFDGIIGFLPNEVQNNNRLLLTGEVNFKLNNLFQSAKSLSLVWQQIKPNSPLLNFRYSHPLLFGTNLGADFQLNLLKQDNDFLNVSRRLALSQTLANASQLSFFVNLQTSSILGDSTKYTDIQQLPSVLSTRLLSYGIDFFRNQTDDLLYPKKGWEINAVISVGNKEILKNATIRQELYENVSLKSVQVTFKAEIKKYFQLQKRTVLLLKSQLGKIQNDFLSQNELFRLGGLQSLRGFNENTFFASAYGTGTAEIRYFLEPETYFFSFFDFAYLQTRFRNQNNDDQPFGTGAGISFSTQAGVFNFVYAVGKSAMQPFGFNFSKIHFGYVSRF